MTYRALRVLCLAALVGCRQPVPPAAVPATGTVAQYTDAINAWYRVEGACLWVVPVRLPRDLPVALATARNTFTAPVAAGLIEQSAPTSATHHFKLTPLGEAAWRPAPGVPGEGNLCYANPEVVAVQSSSPRHDGVYGPVVDVDFTTASTDAQLWAGLPVIQRAYPEISVELHTQRPGSATLTYKDGQWKVASALVHANAIPDERVLR